MFVVGWYNVYKANTLITVEIIKTMKRMLLRLPVSVGEIDATPASTAATCCYFHCCYFLGVCLHVGAWSSVGAVLPPLPCLAASVLSGLLAVGAVTGI